MNARLAFSGLLLLGFADLGLINFKLAPEYAKEQADLAAAAKPTSSAGPSAPTSQTVVKPSVTAVPTRPEPPAAPNPEPPASSAQAPVASAEPVATAEPPATAEPAKAPEPAPTPEPPVAVAPTSTAPPPPAPPVTAVPDKPASSGQTPGAVEDIIFDLDSNRLNAAGKAIVEEVVRQLKANPALKVHVRGHSDQMGSREHNLELSRKRAAAVENFLHANGISGSRITTEAMGGRKPVDPSNTPTAWARNRRVEIEWR